MQIEQTTKQEQVAKTDAAAPKPISWQRRHDVDWMRTLAMALLIVYHVVISFQPWAWSEGFPQTENSLEFLWIFMSMVNIWRIPILFMISGMGVRFAMERRDWKALLKDRTVLILLPFVFGFFFITPILGFASQVFYGQPISYAPGPGHLWFLPYIFAYVLLLIPLLFFLRNRPENSFFRFLTNLFRRPATLFLLAIPLMIESFIFDSGEFVRYQLTPHGFFLGLLLFFIGFLFVSIKDVSWSSAERIRWVALVVAFVLFLLRFSIPGLTESWLTAFESMCWMLAIIGFASLYLNKPSRSLSYFSKAVYPVYIVHLPIQFILAIFIFSLPVPGVVQFVLLLLGTFGVSLLLYEIIKRIRWLRPLFGIKWKTRRQRQPAQTISA